MFCTYCGADLPKKHQGPCPACGKRAPGSDTLSSLGNVLFIPAGARLPDFCVKCNAPAVGNPKRLKLWWHPPAITALILLGLLPYLIVALIMRKKATIEIPRCERHRSAWTVVAWIGLALVLLGIAAFGILIALEANGVGGKKIMDTPVGASACFIVPLAGLAGIIMINFGLRRISPQKIDEQGNAWVKGVCPEFINEHAPNPAPPI